MPFIPVDDDRYGQWILPICKDPEYAPPGMIVVKKVMVWQCPTCKKKTVLYPNTKYCLGD